jgi:type IV secretory pathway VirB4 component
MSLEPVIIGRGDEPFVNGGRQVAIVPEARRRHLAIFGGTGAGKSTLLRGMIASDIAAGRARC